MLGVSARRDEIYSQPLPPLVCFCCVVSFATYSKGATPLSCGRHCRAGVVQASATAFAELLWEPGNLTASELADYNQRLALNERCTILDHHCPVVLHGIPKPLAHVIWFVAQGIGTPRARSSAKPSSNVANIAI